jgi:hypothetical protein
LLKLRGALKSRCVERRGEEPQKSVDFISLIERSLINNS